MKRLGLGALVLAALLGVAPAARAQELIYGMTAASSSGFEPGVGLVSFSSSSPGSVTSLGAFTNVVSGQAVRSIDFRPATGQLYALSTDGAAAAQLYTVNLSNAALTPVGVGFTLGNNNFPSAEIDFNPTVDRIRVLTPGSGVNNNFRVNPNDGTLVATDTNLAYVPGIRARASTRSLSPARTRTTSPARRPRRCTAGTPATTRS